MHEDGSEWNALDVRTRALIRAILYPVMFAADPDDNDIARVFEMVIDCHALNASADEYQAAVQKVLADHAHLEGHSLNAVARPDTITRKFLIAVLKRLEHEAGMSSR
jgi:antirestriction protein